MRSESWTRYRVGGDRSTDAASELAPALAQQGLVLIDDLRGGNDLLRLARSLTTVTPHRDSDAAGLTTITDVGGPVRRGFAGFSACALNPHTDRSGVANPPGLLMMSCGQPANLGGECVVIDGKAVYDELAQTCSRALRALGGPRSVLFGGAAGYLGSIFTRVGDRITIRLRLDDLARFSPEVTRWLPILRATIDRHAVMFGLDAGQGYVLDNCRWLHGRRAFSGQRVMYRVNGHPRPSSGLIPGFLPGGARLP
ncbi:hypothetical protein BLA60_33055 [Actinophytocola xinjiangensis]|uniref:TauD/TfdA-like domain-containing protein n=1 Tax=Actinophytocola xinjiangensis TaxID=485602 RepID=A0A7Z0WHC2_9PSEU|nr:TauD/TfdA family dioxygenase [Actinophytocola xinjiangensis]OLF06239.1 hypothetical protein BLA60_33055 [Actinophytocola xinjiangensis]